MSASELLDRLKKVRSTGAGRWLGCCPAHDDHSPSLAIALGDDGRVLLHCFAGCSVHEVVSAVGLDLSDLFPPREIGVGEGKPERRPFPAIDILRCIASEALVVMMAAKSLLSGSLSEADRKRLIVAVSRIHQAMDAGGISHVKR
jgi:hypothetical protein